MLYFKAKSFEEISNNMDYIVNFGIIKLILLLLIVCLINILVFYIIPINQIYRKTLSDKIEAVKRKKILNQIMAQKEIENEMESEIKNYTLKS